MRQRRALLSGDERWLDLDQLAGRHHHDDGTPGEIEIFWLDGAAKRKSYGKLAAGQTSIQQTYAGHVWLMTDANGTPLAGVKTHGKSPSWLGRTTPRSSLSSTTNAAIK